MCDGPSELKSNLDAALSLDVLPGKDKKSLIAASAYDMRARAHTRSHTLCIGTYGTCTCARIVVLVRSVDGNVIGLLAAKVMLGACLQTFGAYVAPEGKSNKCCMGGEGTNPRSFPQIMWKYREFVIRKAPGQRVPVLQEHLRLRHGNPREPAGGREPVQPARHPPADQGAPFAPRPERRRAFSGAFRVFPDRFARRSA